MEGERELYCSVRGRRGTKGKREGRGWKERSHNFVCAAKSASSGHAAVPGDQQWSGLHWPLSAWRPRPIRVSGRRRGQGLVQVFLNIVDSL